MSNDKSPGNYGLTKEFLETFWSEVKKHFDDVLCTILVKKNLDKDKRLIQDKRPISKCRRKNNFQSFIKTSQKCSSVTVFR